MRQAQLLVCVVLSVCAGAAEAAALDVVQTRLEARETFDPDAKLPRIDLQLFAEITPQSESFDPSTAGVRFDLPTGEEVGILICIGMPIGCFTRDAVKGRFVVRDFVGCGGTFTLQPAPGSNELPLDLTDSVRSFEAQFLINAAWKVGVHMSFLDEVQKQEPCWISLLGGAQRLEVAIAEDQGARAPAQSETQLRDAGQGGELTVVHVDTDVAQSIDTNTQLPRFDVDFRVELDPGAAGFDPKTDPVLVEWGAGAVGVVVCINYPAGCLEPRGQRYVVTDPQGCGATVEVGEPGGDLPPDDVTAGLLYLDAVIKPQPNGNLGFVGSMGLLDDAHPIHDVLAGAKEFRVVLGSSHGAAAPYQVEARAP